MFSRSDVGGYNRSFRWGYTVPVSSIILALFYLCFFIDGLNAILIKHTGHYNSYSQIARGIAELVFCILLLRARCYYPLFVVGFFTLANLSGLLILLVGSDKMLADELFKNVVIVNKFLYVFVVLYVVHSFFLSESSKRGLFRFFEFCFLVYCVSIILGFLFDLDYLRSYPAGSRFGFKGLIVTTNEAVGLFLIGVFYFYSKYISCRRRFDLFMLVFLFLCSILVGAKASVLFISFAVFVLVLPLLKRRRFFLGFSVFVVVFGLGSVFFLIDSFQSTIGYLSYFYHKGDSLLSIMLTGRNWRVEALFEEVFVQGGYPFYNYIFGGFNFLRLGTEMDFFDVMTIFGACGVLFYFLYLRSIFVLSGRNKLVVFFLFVFLTASTLGGHLIYNAVIPVYLAILTVRLAEDRGEKVRVC